MNEVLMELIELLKSTGPKLWGITMRQVYVNAWTCVAFSVGIFLSGAFVLTGMSTLQSRVDEKKLSYGERHRAEENLSILAIFLLTLVVIFCISTTAAVVRFANPEYYAIQKLIQLGR